MNIKKLIDAGLIAHNKNTMKENELPSAANGAKLTYMQYASAGTALKQIFKSGNKSLDDVIYKYFNQASEKEMSQVAKEYKELVKSGYSKSKDLLKNLFKMNKSDKSVRQRMLKYIAEHPNVLKIGVPGAIVGAHILNKDPKNHYTGIPEQYVDQNYIDASQLGLNYDAPILPEIEEPQQEIQNNNSYFIQ